MKTENSEMDSQYYMTIQMGTEVVPLVNLGFSQTKSEYQDGLMNRTQYNVTNTPYKLQCTSKYERCLLYGNQGIQFGFHRKMKLPSLLSSDSHPPNPMESTLQICLLQKLNLSCRHLPEQLHGGL